MWLIRRIREKMLRKWMVINIGITLLIIAIVGFSMKEFACYQFDQMAGSGLASQQFRDIISKYLIVAGLLALLIAIGIHLIAAKKILSPLKRLSLFSRHLDGSANEDAHVMGSRDEVGEIAGHLSTVSHRIDHLNQQQNDMMKALAHELRTPLTTLNGYLEGLEAGVFDQDTSVYSRLREECVQLTDLVDRMHEWQAWEYAEVKPQRMDIETTIRSEVSLFQHRLAQQGIEVDMRVEAMNIDCDPNGISAILSRLLDNAIRYHQTGPIVIEGKPEGRGYQILVSNQGAPIPESVAGHLFDPFTRVEDSRNRSTGGVGLGLAVVKDIVQRLGGTITFDSEKSFHTFHIIIPKNNE